MFSKEFKRFAALALLALSVLTVTSVHAKPRFTIDITSEPSSLDPHKQWNNDSYFVYRNIFDNLVTRDDKGDIQPEIATSWRQVSETVMEFQIRSDVVFHDGRKLTPEDVVFSVMRIINPAFASPQRGQFNKITQAEVTGPQTVRLITDGPYPALLAQLVKLSIVPRHVVEAVGDAAFNLKPVGSGPYSFEEWRKGVSVTLKRNDAYWGRKGPFEVAVFRAVRDGATRVANLQAGAADLVTMLDADLAKPLRNSSRAKTLTALTERVAYVRLNTAKPPFDNLQIRQAVSLAMDRQGMVDGILEGFDKALGQMLTPAHEGYAASLPMPAYDVKRAQALVRQAGAAAQVEIELATSPVFDQRIVQAIQQMLTEIGLKVKINMADMASYLKRAQGGLENVPQMSFGRWSCACQDADGVLHALLHSSSGWSGYHSPVTDKLLDDARQTLDRAKRDQAYRQVSQIVMEQAPLIPLYQSAAIYGAARQLQWTPTPNESLFLNRMSWKD